MSLGDKFTEAFCWLKEEFDEILKDFDFDLEKNEEAFKSLCNKVNEKVKKLGTSTQIEKPETDYINIKKIINWNNLNFCIFHYSPIYKKVHENLFIEEEDYAINFDEDNFYVKKKFPFDILFHPLIYSVDVSYYNFLVSFILGLESESTTVKCESETYLSGFLNSNSEQLRDFIPPSQNLLKTTITDDHENGNKNGNKNGNENGNENGNDTGTRTRTEIGTAAEIGKEKRKKRKNKIIYVMNDNIEFQKKCTLSNVAYTQLCTDYPVIPGVHLYIEEEKQLFNFQTKKNVDEEDMEEEHTTSDVEEGETWKRTDKCEKGYKEEEEIEKEIKQKEQKEESKETSRETSREISRETSKETSKEEIKRKKIKGTEKMEETDPLGDKKKSKKEQYAHINNAFKYTIQNKVYMVDENLNKKIKVFNGNVAKINTQAILLFANNNYKFSKDICNNLFSSNIMKLEEEERYEIRHKKSGEVYVTNSYDNIHKYVLHVMLPKYNSKFILATNNTMNLCVQEILHVCYEKKIETISIPIVFFNLFFPINIFLLTFLKSIRSFILLPQFYKTIKSIVFVTNSNDVYFMLLKYLTIFFPRNDQEQYLSTNISVIGNKFGAVDVHTRSIRIFKSLRFIKKRKKKKNKRKKKENTKKNKEDGLLKKETSTEENRTTISKKKHIKQNARSSDKQSLLNEKKYSGAENIQNNDDSLIDISSSNESSLSQSESCTSYFSYSNSSASSTFSSSTTSSTVSEIFKEADAEFRNLKTENESYKNFFNLNQVNKNEEMNFEYCLRLSYVYDKKGKFEELKNNEFIYEYGFDELGRQIIVINFFNFPLVCNFNILFFYLIFYFNNFMKNHFILLFIFSEKISSNLTNVLSLFKDLFQMIQDFLINLKIIYVFNYSLMFKFFIYVLYPFIPSNIFHSVIYLNDTVELAKYFDVKKALRKD